MVQGNRILWPAAFIALCALAGGCSSNQRLPDGKKVVIENLPDIPPDASPVFAWTIRKIVPHTYWRAQEILVQVRAHLPADYREVKDGLWEAKAQNAEGKVIPFIGVMRKRQTESGRDVYEVPKLEMQRMTDGLYVAIDPNVTLADGKVASILPVAVLLEIRKHMLQPFRYRLPLIPQQDSPLTPRPVLPVEPEGTVVPF